MITVNGARKWDFNLSTIKRQKAKDTKMANILQISKNRYIDTKMANILQISKNRYIDTKTGATYARHVPNNVENIYWVIKFPSRDAEEVRGEFAKEVEEFVNYNLFQPIFA